MQGSEQYILLIYFSYNILGIGIIENLLSQFFFLKCFFILLSRLIYVKLFKMIGMRSLLMNIAFTIIYPIMAIAIKTVRHSKGEYARDEDGDGFCEVHSNTMEGFWSLLRS